MTRVRSIRPGTKRTLPCEKQGCAAWAVYLVLFDSGRWRGVCGRHVRRFFGLLERQRQAAA